MVEVPPGELLVVRFAPVRPEKLIEQARAEAAYCAQRGEPPVHSVSVFGLIRPDPQTSLDTLIETICREAPVGGRNVWLTTRTDLAAVGLTVRPSEPPRHHHDVVFGEQLDPTDVQAFVQLLERDKRRNPAWKG